MLSETLTRYPVPRLPGPSGASASTLSQQKIQNEAQTIHEHCVRAITPECAKTVGIALLQA